jgi:hypothetical protein
VITLSQVIKKKVVIKKIDGKNYFVLPLDLMEEFAKRIMKDAFKTEEPKLIQLFANLYRFSFHYGYKDELLITPELFAWFRKKIDEDKLPF